MLKQSKHGSLRGQTVKRSRLPNMELKKKKPATGCGGFLKKCPRLATENNSKDTESSLQNQAIFAYQVNPDQFVISVFRGQVRHG
jgi:hypothetical protein